MTDLSDRASESQIAVNAAAKINLYLHVTGRRPDGYHELDSLVGFTEVGDQILAERADEISLKIVGPFSGGLSVNEDNLVLRAARSLAREAGCQSGSAITLQKNLPVSSGIGGGSSDAAATLHALNTLWQTNLSPDELAQIGLGLGADVPVCLLRKTARMSGIGEVICPMLPLPDFGVLLINPRVPVSTRQGFKARHGPFSSVVEETVPADRAEFCRFLLSQKNDLQDPAIEFVPVIAKVLETLSAQTGCHMARLSGSGATCFGLFDDQEAAAAAGIAISTQHAGWWIQPTRFLS